MSQLQVVEPALTALGYQILALSPDTPENLAATHRKAGTAYVPLSDSGMQAARGFGIAFQVPEAMSARLKGFGIDLVKASGRSHEQLPVPSVFLVGADGRIQFQYVNPAYQYRLAPEVLEAAARAALGAEPVWTRSPPPDAGPIRMQRRPGK